MTEGVGPRSNVQGEGILPYYLSHDDAFHVPNPDPRLTGEGAGALQ